MVFSMKLNMYHKCPGHIHNSLNIPLGFIILMWRSNNRKTLILIFLIAILLKHIYSEDPIIPVEMCALGFCLIPKQSLKLQLSHELFPSFKRHLIFNPNNSRLRINIYCPSMEPIIGDLLSIYTW